MDSFSPEHQQAHCPICAALLYEDLKGLSICSACILQRHICDEGARKLHAAIILDRYVDSMLASRSACSAAKSCLDTMNVSLKDNSSRKSTIKASVDDKALQFTKEKLASFETTAESSYLHSFVWARDTMLKLSLVLQASLSEGSTPFTELSKDIWHTRFCTTVSDLTDAIESVSKNNNAKSVTIMPSSRTSESSGWLVSSSTAPLAPKRNGTQCTMPDPVDPLLTELTEASGTLEGGASGNHIITLASGIFILQQPLFVPRNTSIIGASNITNIESMDGKASWKAQPTEKTISRRFSSVCDGTILIGDIYMASNASLLNLNVKGHVYVRDCCCQLVSCLFENAAHSSTLPLNGAHNCQLVDNMPLDRTQNSASGLSTVKSEARMSIFGHASLKKKASRQFKDARESVFIGSENSSSYPGNPCIVIEGALTSVSIKDCFFNSVHRIPLKNRTEKVVNLDRRSNYVPSSLIRASEYAHVSISGCYFSSRAFDHSSLNDTFLRASVCSVSATECDNMVFQTCNLDRSAAIPRQPSLSDTNDDNMKARRQHCLPGTTDEQSDALRFDSHYAVTNLTFDKMFDYAKLSGAILNTNSFFLHADNGSRVSISSTVFSNAFCAVSVGNGSISLTGSTIRNSTVGLLVSATAADIQLMNMKLQCCGTGQLIHSIPTNCTCMFSSYEHNLVALAIAPPADGTCEQEQPKTTRGAPQPHSSSLSITKCIFTRNNTTHVFATVDKQAAKGVTIATNEFHVGTAYPESRMHIEGDGGQILANMILSSNSLTSESALKVRLRIK